MNLVNLVEIDGKVCIPRVSGDEPITVGTNVARILYSPRERG